MGIIYAMRCLADEPYRSIVPQYMLWRDDRRSTTPVKFKNIKSKTRYYELSTALFLLAEKLSDGGRFGGLGFSVLMGEDLIGVGEVVVPTTRLEDGDGLSRQDHVNSSSTITDRNASIGMNVEEDALFHPPFPSSSITLNISNRRQGEEEEEAPIFIPSTPAPHDIFNSQHALRVLIYFFFLNIGNPADAKARSAHWTPLQSGPTLTVNAGSGALKNQDLFEAVRVLASVWFDGQRYLHTRISIQHTAEEIGGGDYVEMVRTVAKEMT